MSQQRSRVPKFGSWDADNGQFSGDFETARKERATAVGMNPNDEQEDLEAFGRVGHGSEVHVDSDNLKVAEKHPTGGLGKDNLSRRIRSMVSASGSDKSSPNQQQKPRRSRSDRKKSLTEFVNFSTSSPGSGMLRASNASDDKDMSNRSTSVPKFGAWDETDGSEGYTVIFEKVKEEKKQNAATQFTAATPKPSKSVDYQNKRTRSKTFCCLC